jgi:hypothetical protein
MEGLMNESAEHRIMAAIGKNHEEVLKKVDSLTDKYHATDKRVTSLEDQLEVLHTDRADKIRDRRQDFRKIKDVLLQIAVVLVLTGLLTLGIQYVKRGTPETAPQGQQGAATSQDVRDLIDEIRTDREARESEAPAKTIKVPPGKAKPRGPAPNPLIQRNDQREWADQFSRSYIGTVRLASLEMRF